MRIDPEKARAIVRERTGITVEPFDDFVELVQAIVDGHDETSTGEALVKASERVTALETELASVSGELADLIAFLKVAQWRYGAKAASRYAEGWHACAVAALDWVDKHPEGVPR